MFKLTPRDVRNRSFLKQASGVLSDILSQSSSVSRFSSTFSAHKPILYARDARIMNMEACFGDYDLLSVPGAEDLPYAAAATDSYKRVNEARLDDNQHAHGSPSTEQSSHACIARTKVGTCSCILWQLGA